MAYTPKDKDLAPENNKYSDANPKAELENEIAKLDAIERTTGSSGVVPSMPKKHLLNIDDAQKQNPNQRIKWVNVNNKEKYELRKANGYEPIPIAEGGRQVGNLMLHKLPREEYDRRVEEIKRINKDRLSSHKTEVEQAAEGIMRELRDHHGIKANILISE